MRPGRAGWLRLGSTAVSIMMFPYSHLACMSWLSGWRDLFCKLIHCKAKRNVIH